MSTIYKYDKRFKAYHWLEKNPRFSVQRKEGVNHLHISDYHFSDSATDFCGCSHSNMVEFGQGVFLSVKGNVLLYFIGFHLRCNAEVDRHLHPFCSKRKVRTVVFKPVNMHQILYNTG